MKTKWIRFECMRVCGKWGAMPCAFSQFLCVLMTHTDTRDAVVSREDEHCEIDEAEDEQSKSLYKIVFFFFAISVDVCFFVGCCGADFVCKRADDWVTRARLVLFSSIYEIILIGLKLSALTDTAEHTLFALWTNWINKRDAIYYYLPFSLFDFSIYIYICHAIQSHSMLDAQHCSHKNHALHTLHICM